MKLVLVKWVCGKLWSSARFFSRFVRGLVVYETPNPKP